MKKSTRGFTIVELLIVIVVIAILAAISIVAYNGIQNRANDAAIQNDLASFAKKIQIAAADIGEYPVAGAVRSGAMSTGNSTQFSGFSFAPSKSAYMTTVNNLFYCTGVETASGQKIFRVLARSKSGNAFRYSSNDGVQNLGDVNINEATACTGMNDPQTWSYGYYNIPQTWWGWTSN